MKLNYITSGPWKEISNYLNYNFNKLGISAVRTDEIWTSGNLNFKGVFTSAIDLNLKFPNPLPGDYAFVLDIQNDITVFKIYSYKEGGIWEPTGGTYSPIVSPEDYIEVATLQNITDLNPDIEDYLEGH